MATSSWPSRASPTNSETPQPGRYHELDALRAGAMLLGVYWHAAFFPALIELFSGRPSPLDPVSRAFIISVHGFRMQLFFLLAGFFAALLLERAGARGFTRARLRRVGIPLAVSLVTVVPAAQVAFALSAGRPVDREVLVPVNLNVVWFLWYLLLLYAISLAVVRAVPRSLAGRAGEAFARLVRSPLRVPLLAAPAALLLWGMPGVEYEAPLGAAPDTLALAYFGGYFAFGWLLWSRRELIDVLGRRPLAHAVAAVALALVSVRTVRLAAEDPGWTAEASVCLALLSWCAIFAAFGAARRFLSQPRGWVRYLSDASYWIYLAHAPLVTGLGVLLLRQGVPYVLIAPLAGTAVCAVLLIAYRTGVRHTFVGRTLHGPRPRGGRMDDMQRSSEGAEMPILRS